ncbi:MAG: hypothetical protein M1134_00325 [Actinobacteria bacterium]|nr:hypothetical protein [Actinomycetota bacterium]MCL5445346.1 hypothetical protein [Actinomycetota bacterium]
MENVVKSRARTVRATTRSLALMMVCLLAGGVLAACGSSSSSSTSSTAASSATLPTQAGAKVLLVGTFKGHRGQFATIQAAVNAAKPGDWILVAPGDYHETADESQAVPSSAFGAGNFGGVIIHTPNLHIRGMNRNGVIVDGTKPGSSTPCSSNPALQNFGPIGPGGKAEGRNGIVVFKTNGVSIQNLTVCNFLSGAGSSGNEIWWNGGEGTAKIGMGSYYGSYLTATSTYFGGESTAAAYGVFSSNASGPGYWNQIYTSNFNDSGLYVGACQQLCNMVINHAWSEYSALGYSGSNSGGSLVVENSQFDNNKDGFDTNSQNSADPPTPQNGACPNGGISPITHTHSCWVFMHNSVHNNNNPNVPLAGSASAGPTGTGMTVSGGRNDTIMDNHFYNNGAWGFLFVPYPDTGTPATGQHCQGGVPGSVLKAKGGVLSLLAAGGVTCYFDAFGNTLAHNTFYHNGFFANPSNSDFGQIRGLTGNPQNCFIGNVAPDGTAPSNLQATQSQCGKIATTQNTGGPLLAQVICDSGFGYCSANAKYPQPTGVIMHPLPANLPTMPNPCVGVPADPWCPGGKPL